MLLYLDLYDKNDKKYNLYYNYNTVL